MGKGKVEGRGGEGRGEDGEGGGDKEKDVPRDNHRNIHCGKSARCVFL